MRERDASEDDTAARGRPHLMLRTGPAMALLLFLALALNAYYLGGGFQGEDYIFVNSLREDPLPYSRLMGCWSKCDYPALANIWWFKGEGVHAFWRPLPSIVIEASVRVFGERAFPLHVLSLVVHGLVGGTLFLIVRRLTGRPLLGLLCALLFLACEDHTMGVGWIATITDLLCVLFVNLALLAHARWLERRQPWTLVAALACLVCALLSKESAVVAPLAVVLMTLLMPRGREARLPSGREAWRLAGSKLIRDPISWLPMVILLVAYLGVYRLLGFGGLTTGMYVDPLAEPSRYAAHLVLHLPIMWLASLSPIPPSIPMFWPPVAVPLAAAGAAAFAIWVAGLWRLRRSALVAWAMSVYLLALLPQMATDAGERGLYFPTIGASILLALLLVQIPPIARRVAPADPRPSRLARALGWAVLLCVLAPGVLLSAAMPFLYRPALEKPGAQAATVLPHVAQRAPDHLLVLNTPGPLHTFYFQPVVAFHAGADLDVRVLSALNGVMSVERVDERSFVLRTDRPGWLTNMFAGMLRARGRLRAGEVFEKGPVRATLVELTPDSRDILAVRFAIDHPLDDRGLLVVRWDGEAFRPIDLAALPPGRPVTLADTSGAWASMW